MAKTEKGKPELQPSKTQKSEFGLLEAAIATGLSRVVAKKWLNQLSEKQVAELKKYIVRGKLLPGFRTKLVQAHQEVLKRERGENKNVMPPAKE